MSTIKEDRKTFEALLNGISAPLINSVPQVQPIPTVQAPCVDGSNAMFVPEKAFDFDYDAVKKMLRKKARKTVNNIVSHIIPEDIIGEDYIKDKIEQDTDTMTDLYMQLETNNIMQKSLIESVAKGNSMPRMYEVFSQMTDRISLINKQIVSTEQNIRKTYIDLKMEIRDMEMEVHNANMMAMTQQTLPGPNDISRPAEQGIMVSSSKQLIEMAKRRHIDKMIETEYQEEK